jgi:hypothetical protein
MYTLTKEDQVLIKNSTSWASRSITKLRSYFDKKYGSNIRNLIVKSVNCTDEVKEMYDKFVSSGDSKTKYDFDALSKFASICTSYDNFANHIIKIMIPELNKNGIQISLDNLVEKEKPKDDKQKKEDDNKEDNKKEDNKKENKKEDKPKVKPPSPPVHTEAPAINRKDMVAEISSKLSTLGVLPVPKLSEEDGSAFQQLLIDTEKTLSQTKDLLNDGSVSDKDALAYYTSAMEKLQSLLAAYSKITKAQGEYGELIKMATTMEEIGAYYLMSLADYGSIKTPIKEKILAVKNFIGFGVDPTIDNLRKDCIKYSKDLIKESEKITDAVEHAAKNKTDKAAWIALMKQYNEFAGVYNTHRPFYINLYSALKIKINQDKILKSKKDKKVEKGDAAIRDVIDYS